MFEGFRELPPNAQLLLPLAFSFLGGLFSLIFQPFIARFNKRLELSGRAWERVQDRRLDAYEALLAFAKNLKVTATTGNHKNGHIETKSVHLESKATFETLMDTFINCEAIWTDWVDQRTSQHTKYLVDYFQNLRIVVSNIDDGELEELSVRLKCDFVDLSSETIVIAHKFFSKIDRRLLKPKGNGKYRLEKTRRLLLRTELGKFMIENDLLLKD